MTYEFTALDERSLLLERGMWLSPGHLVTIAVGMSRSSGSETGDSTRRTCGESLIFRQPYCTTWYEVVHHEPAWSPTAEASVHFVLRRAWSFLPSRIVVGGRIGSRSSMTGLMMGVGYGGAGR